MSHQISRVAHAQKVKGKVRGGDLVAISGLGNKETGIADGLIIGICTER